MRVFLIFFILFFAMQAKASCNPDPAKLKVHSDKEAMFFSLGFMSALQPESNYKFIGSHHRKCAWGIELQDQNETKKTIIVRVGVYGQGYIEPNE